MARFSHLIVLICQKIIVVWIMKIDLTYVEIIRTVFYCHMEEHIQVVAIMLINQRLMKQLIPFIDQKRMLFCI